MLKNKKKQLVHEKTLLDYIIILTTLQIHATLVTTVDQ